MIITTFFLNFKYSVYSYLIKDVQGHTNSFSLKLWYCSNLEDSMVPPPNNNLQQQQHLNCQHLIITTLRLSAVTRRDAIPQFSYDHD